MNYYHDLVTQKSWEELIELRKKIDFVLIGGWAVYFYTRTLKSKDIDIIIDYDQLPILAQHYLLNKNERLFKYEAVKGEIQIDIYLPHFSRLGIPAEELMQRPVSVEGMKTINVNFLFVLKLYTLSERGRSPKGRKDFLDLVALADSERCDMAEIKKISIEHDLQNSIADFMIFLKETSQAPELNLNPHRFSKLKKELMRQLQINIHS